VSRLFGLPVGTLAVALAVVLAGGLGILGALAARNRVFLRLGVRSLRRRPGRSALIVVGLMLGTSIVTAALATGDTMSHTIRSSAVTALGRTDEVVGAKGIGATLSLGSNGATGSRYIPQGDAERIARAVARSGLVAGVAPVISESVAAQDLTTRQTEPRVTLFASDPARLRPFGDIRAGSETVSLSQLRPREIYLNADAANELHAHAGDTVRVYAGARTLTARVRAIVHYDGGATDGPGVLMPLGPAQQLLGKPGLVRGIFIANAGGVVETDRVLALLKPTLTPLGLEADNTKQDALEAADTAGATFMAMFTTFGSFSIAAGTLLIFLIFVMLAAERRGELGIARAVGTRRGHLVQMFIFEGVAYDLIAAAVGALIGVAVAYGMVIAMASAFASTSDLAIGYHVRPVSIVLAYALGVLLTLAVVAFSAWRVSRMNIVAAIRNLPDAPAQRTRRRRSLAALIGIAVGLLLAYAGVRANDSVPLGLGVSLVILSAVPLSALLHVPGRLARSVAGIALIAWFVFPFNRWLFGEMKVNFSIFVLGGLMIVVGATWTIVYNADILLGALGATGGRLKPLAPVLRMAIAYPLRNLFRTGVTLAMFTLVVFTLVVGATTSGSFVHAFNDVGVFGGGFDVRATTSPGAPILDMPNRVGRLPGMKRSDFRVVASLSSLPVKARQVGTGSAEESYPVNGADAAFLENTTYGLAARATGYASNADVWRGLRVSPNLAVVDQFAVERRAVWGTQLSKFHLTGFYLEDETFAPVRIRVRDPQTGRQLTLTVIGVLSDSAPPLMSGIWTSQRTLAHAFGDRVLPTTHLFALRPGIDAGTTASKLESAFLANGVQADSLRKLLKDNVGASLTFNRLIMGFMGLGLIVGVAALGVITARAVVERRQQIGVLRAIGFRRRAVQMSFLIESSFVALTSIVVGTGLGLAVAYNVILDSRRSPSWAHMAFVVPWLTLGVVFLAVYLVALATTLVPALRASRIYPAQALRYE
jgi:putative ABC transport system permease protein